MSSEQVVLTSHTIRTTAECSCGWTLELNNMFAARRLVKLHAEHTGHVVSMKQVVTETYKKEPV